MKNVTNKYGNQVKVSYSQVKPAKKELLKHTPTRYIHDQH